MSNLTHTDYMTSALTLAARGRCTVSPNPMVGCVIVNQGQIVGEGYHVQAGGPHAEIIALQQAGPHAKDATAYVTLEPCCHYGRTPPCTNALIQAGIREVYVACKDPNLLVAGKGIAALQAAGIAVEVGLMEQEAIALNEIFFHYMRTRTPFVIAKWAMSLDGKTVTHKNDSRDISSSVSRESTHQTRQQVDAILIGSNTAILDNPLLTARLTPAAIKQPLRIILTSQGDLPLELNLLDPSLPGSTLVATTTLAKPAWIQQLTEKNIEVLVLPSNAENKVDLPSLLTALGKKGMTSLLVEGGMTVLHDFFHHRLVNKVHVYLAPTIIGGLQQKQILTNLTLSHLHPDYFITADYESNAT
jgi:diaminohydroxyphosphoribosylaminopyrimidine deaminase/5-amino-6-(5-phosphoribosylamino)uracil reductase